MSSPSASTSRSHRYWCALRLLPVSFLLSAEGAWGMLAGPDALIEDRAMETIGTAYMISIGGGTDQIQRNIVGERILGLPAEPRLDKTVPFDQLPGA